MIAYLIDPLNEAIAVIVHDESDQELRAILQCGKFTVLRREGLYKGDGLYLDENYKTRPLVPRFGLFSFKGIAGVIPGRALISGHTEDGEMCDPRTPIKRVRELVSWG